MKLKSLHEDHWEPIAGHPGKLGELDARARKRQRPSFLVKPSDRERFLKRVVNKKS